MENGKEDQIKKLLENLEPDTENNPQPTFNNVKAAGDVIGGSKYQGNFASRDVVNNIIQPISRKLTKNERRALHNLVKKLDEEFGESGKQTWSSIHRIIGVDSIEEIDLEQYKPTESILTLLLENAQLRNAVKVLHDDDSLQEELDQSASALTKLTERNCELAASLKQHQQAYSILDAKSKQAYSTLEAKSKHAYSVLDAISKKQAAEIEGLSSQLKAALEKLKSIPAARTSIATARKRFAIAAIIMALTSVSTVALAIQNFTLSQELQEAKGRISVCEFDDKPFAVGSVLDYEGDADLKCIIVHPGMAPQWGPVSQKSGRQPIKVPHMQSRDSRN